MFVENQTFGSNTLIAYTVRGGANSEGYPIRPVIVAASVSLDDTGTARDGAVDADGVAVAGADAVADGDAVGDADPLGGAETGFGD